MTPICLPLDETILFDKYGFAVLDDLDSERFHHYTNTINLSTYTDLTWTCVLETIGESFSTDTKAFAKVYKMMQTGVPDNVRPLLWKRLLQSDVLKQTSSFCYKAHITAIREQLVDIGVSEYGGRAAISVLCEIESLENQENQKSGHIDVKVIRQIMLDIDRTYPTHNLFMGSTPMAKEGRAKLFMVLTAYVRYNPTVGYCQGMSFIVGMLLMHMSEEDSFWCSVSLFERQKYLAGYFDNSLGRIKRHVSVFDKILKQRLPGLDQHFTRIGLVPLMYTTPWFMCLYTGLPCWDTILSIWDRIMIDGVCTIFSVALAILTQSQDDLLAAQDLTQLLPRLLHVPAEICNYDSLVPVMWKTRVEKWEIDSLLSVIHEETKTVGYTQNRSRQKRHHSTMENEYNQNKKRQKIEKEEVEPSVFERFVNLFTPRSQRIIRDSDRTSSSVENSKKAVSKNLTAKFYRSEVKENSNSSPVVQFFKTPVRRSPRIARKLRNVNIPSVNQLVASNAKVQHSFKTFHTPKPLRQSQQSAISSTTVAFISPEVELEVMSINKRQQSHLLTEDILVRGHNNVVKTIA